ncbi:hypothetical protein JOM56_014012 [Amanita muscaria]
MDDDADAQQHSLVDIDHDLHRIFNDHSQSHFNDAGEPIIPADALVDVFQSLADIYNGIHLLSSEEMDMLKALLASNPGLEVTPQILLDFIAEKAKHASSPHSPPKDQGGDSQDRERPLEDQLSDESNGSIGLPSGSLSRPPSRGPGGTTKNSLFDIERRQRSQPLNMAPSSWTTKRPMPAGRRKSIDAGSRSDSESFMNSPGGNNRSASRQRSRPPSNPTSPTFSHSGIFSPPTPSPAPSSYYGLSQSTGGTSPYSRPSSRNTYHSHSQSQPTTAFDMAHITSPPSSFNDSYTRSGYRSGYSSSEENAGPLNQSDSPLYDRGRRRDNAFMLATSRSSISPLPPSATNLDGAILDHRNDLTSADLSDMSSSSSDEEDDSALGLVMDRTVNASTTSLEPLERMDALQRANAELGRKLIEAEATLQRKLLEHESELEEMQSKLDEMRTELVATKREEKELRSKERQNMTQIAALEAEIVKVTRALDHARVTYTSLQKQYQEQCAVSEKYRDNLRIREEAVRTLREAANMHELETAKMSREQDSYEARIANLESELTIAQQAHAQLDEQKQENLLLKETIDRMRFEMDDMRSGLNLGLQQGLVGPPGSARGTISKSLGAELAGKMKWGVDDEGEEGTDAVRERREDEDSTASEEGSSFNSETAVELDGSAEEDVIQTIITKRKRKILSRANKTEIMTTQLFEESKEYSDSGAQYDLDYFFVADATQTDPEPEISKVVTASVDVQTGDVELSTPRLLSPASIAITLPRVMVEMEVQTDDHDMQVEEEEDERNDESLASSSSTIIPPTPRPITPVVDVKVHHDEPPAYTSVASSSAGPSLSLGLEGGEGDWRMAAELLKKWHRGAKIPIDGVPGGISEEAAAEWRALKEELGVECMVIDKIMERSATIPATPMSGPGAAADGASPQGVVKSGVSRIGRFYNIYNTYVYGAGPHRNEPKSPNSFLFNTLTSFARQAAMWAGASAAVLFFMGPYIAPAPYGGGPTYFDRYAWNSFNALHAGAGEGLVGPAGRFGLGGDWFGFGGGAGYAAGGAVAGAGAGAGGAAVDGTAAVWNILGRVGGGAARMARGWPT